MRFCNLAAHREIAPGHSVRGACQLLNLPHRAGKLFDQTFVGVDSSKCFHESLTLSASASR